MPSPGMGRLDQGLPGPSVRHERCQPVCQPKEYKLSGGSTERTFRGECPFILYGGVVG